MRMKLLIPLAGTIALTLSCVTATRATPEARAEPPAITAKKAEANRVLKEIASIDESLNTVSEQYDGARVRLDALRKDLATEQGQLVQAKARYAKAQKRAASLLVWLYTSNKASSLDVILGATSLTQMLRLSDAENAISLQAATITRETAAAKLGLQVRVHALDRSRAEARSTVKELAARRTTILRGLAQRRKLLASVQAEVNKLEAQERARQARLAAEARARLAAELAARAKALAAAEAKAKAQAAAAATAKARAAASARAARTSTTTPTAASTSTQTPTTQAPVGSTQVATTVDPSSDPSPTGLPSTSTAATTTPIVGAGANPPLVGPLPAGHPEAAQIALQYLGVPYLWGGSTPAGFDCSGLVSYVFAQLGVDLPHFAAAQWDFGVPVPVTDLQPGDLVFFDGLDHVGIYLGANEFVNAPHTGSFVRIDTLDEPWYAKHYVGARRI